MTRPFAPLLPTVPHPRDSRGREIFMSFFDHEFLELEPRGACGSCKEGIYVRLSSDRAALELRLAEIDWDRVSFVKRRFIVKMGRGVVVISSDDCWAVTEVRLRRLLRACSKSVPDEAFLKEVRVAVRIAGRDPSTVHGSLFA